MKFESEFFHSLLDNLTEGVFFVDRDRRVTFWNKAAEQITGYTALEALGKKIPDEILGHLDGEGRELCIQGRGPLTLAIQDSMATENELYLHHRDGHRISVFARFMPVVNTRQEVIGAAEVFSDLSSRSDALRRLHELARLAMVDQLTGLASRRYLEVSLQARIAAMQRYNWPFGILFMDIDRFKRVNDTYGHDVGDKVLKMVARTMMSSMRPFDVVGRWGGEEFMGIVLNASPDNITTIANRYRLLIEKSELLVGTEPVRITVSVGATLATPDDDYDSLIKRVDRLLYQSKANGRNCVSTKLEDAPEPPK